MTTWYPLISDNFQRADSTTVGNGWTDVAGGIWSIANDQLIGASSNGNGFNADLLCRAGDAPLLDSRITATFIAGSGIGNVGVGLRDQQSAAGSATYYLGFYYNGTLYVFYINQGNASQPQQAGLTTSLTDGSAYTLDFSAIGSNPTTLTLSLRDSSGNTLGTVNAGDSTASLQVAGVPNLIAWSGTASYTSATTYTDVSPSSETGSAGGGSSSPYRFWGIKSSPQSPGYMAVEDFTFATSVGGTNLATDPTKANATSYANSGNNPGNAVDQNPGTAWTNGGGGVQGGGFGTNNETVSTWWYDFGTPVAIAQFSIRCQNPGEAPGPFSLLCSNDATNWVDAQDYTPATWSNGSSQTFLVTNTVPVAASPATLTAHRYWGITGSPQVAGYMSVAGITLSATAGGANLANNQTGAYATSSANSQNEPVNTVDNNPSTQWTNTGGQGGETHSTLWYDFLEPVNIAQITIQSEGGNPQYSPRLFSIVYSDDAVTFTPVITYTAGLWSAAEIQTFSVPGGGSSSPTVTSADWRQQTSDSFQRADTTAGAADTTTGVGNGWTDIAGGIWSISGDALLGYTSDTGGFGSDFLTRPTTEFSQSSRITGSFVFQSSGLAALGWCVRGSGRSYYMAAINGSSVEVYAVTTGSPVKLITSGVLALTAGRTYGIDLGAIGFNPTTLLISLTDATTGLVVYNTSVVDQTAALQSAGVPQLVVWSGGGTVTAKVTNVVTYSAGPPTIVQAGYDGSGDVFKPQLPAAPSPGNALLLLYAGYAGSLTLPTGFTILSDYVPGSGQRITVAYRAAVAGDGTDYSFGHTGDNGSAAIFEIAGFSPNSLVVTNGINTGYANGTFSTAALTVSTDPTSILRLFMIETDQSNQFSTSEPGWALLNPYPWPNKNANTNHAGALWLVPSETSGVVPITYANDSGRTVYADMQFVGSPSGSGGTGGTGGTGGGGTPPTNPTTTAMSYCLVFIMA